MEARGHSLLLMGLQQEAEASCYEAMAWEATFEESLPPEQWHEGRAFNYLVRQAMSIKRAGDYRSRGWRQLLSTNTLEREPGRSLFSYRNNRRPLSVTYNEQRRVAGLMYEKRTQWEEEQLELFQQQLEYQQLEELDQQQQQQNEQQEEEQLQPGFFQQPFMHPPPPTADIVEQFIFMSGQ
jgi:hypothetical protein